MSIRHGLTIIVLFFMVNDLATSKVLTLYDAYKLAQKYDAQLASAQLSLKSAEASRDISWSFVLPEVFLQVGKTWQNAVVGPQSLRHGIPSLGSESITGFTVSAAQTLFTMSDWGTLLQSQRSVSLADLGVKIHNEQLLVDIITLYFNAASSVFYVKQLELQKKLLSEKMAIVSENMYLGNSTVYDQQQVAIQQKLLMAQLLAAKVDLKKHYLQLERRTGQKENQVYIIQSDIQLPVCTQSLLEVFEKVEQGSKSLRSMLLQEKLTRIAKFSSLTQHLPKISVDLTYSYQNPKGFVAGPNSVALGIPQEQVQLQAKLNLIIPLYLGGRVIASTRQADVSVQQAQLNLRDTRDQLREAVSNLLGQWDSALLQEKALSSAVQSAEVAFFSSQVGYKNGVLQLSDTLLMQQQFFAAQYQLLQVRIAILQYYFQLKVWQGELYEKDLFDLQDKLDPVGVIGKVELNPF